MMGFFPRQIQEALYPPCRCLPGALEWILSSMVFGVGFFRVQNGTETVVALHPKIWLGFFWFRSKHDAEYMTDMVEMRMLMMMMMMMMMLMMMMMMMMMMHDDSTTITTIQ